MAGDVLLEVAGQSVVFLTHAQVERNATILPRVVFFIYVRNATIFFMLAAVASRLEMSSWRLPANLWSFSPMPR
jgi:hypothetical protein